VLSASSDSAAPSTGAGITAYRRNTLAFLSNGSDGAPVRLAAHVVGFYDLEVLTELATGGFSAGALAQAPPLDSGAIRFPLGIAVGDVDGDA
jgi:hypothetical protein